MIEIEYCYIFSQYPKIIKFLYNLKAFKLQIFWKIKNKIYYLLEIN